MILSLVKMNDFPMVPIWEKVNDVDMQNITSNMTSFTQLVRSTLEDLSYQAAIGKSRKKTATKEVTFGYNLTSVNKVYTLAQCTPDISVTDCKSCLYMIIGNMTNLCYNRAGCTEMNPSCYVKIEMYPFYGDALLSGSEASPLPYVRGKVT